MLRATVRSIPTRLALCFSACLLHAVPAAAEQVEVTIETKQEIREAIGLILTGKGAQQVTGTKVHQASETLKTISFSFDAEAAGADAVVTAVATLANGEVAFANVRPLVKGQSNRHSFASVPDCVPDESTKVSVSEQFGLFESLVKIRSARREVNQIKIQKLMQGPFLEKLKRLERGFGLAQPRELAPDLSHFELVDRLSRLAAAIRNYNRNKVKSTQSG